MGNFTNVFQVAFPFCRELLEEVKASQFRGSAACCIMYPKIIRMLLMFSKTRVCLLSLSVCSYFSRLLN